MWKGFLAMSDNPNIGRWRVFLGRPSMPADRTYLTSGPLMTIPERRQALVERMAKDLVDHNLFVDLNDSVRALRGWGYHWMEVALLAEEARTAAFQMVVAREMSDG